MDPKTTYSSKFTRHIWFSILHFHSDIYITATIVQLLCTTVLLLLLLLLLLLPSPIDATVNDPIDATAATTTITTINTG